MTIESSSTTTATVADRQAQQNWKANLPALKATQPHLVDAIRNLPLHLQWIYARDGALTALDARHQWLANCSLPRRASQQMLRSMQPAGHACLAYPFHPVQLEIALTRLPSHCAIHAILPDVQALAITLHCCDFSADIRSHRLFFAPGPDWPDQLAHTLRAYPGLPVPQNLVRTIAIKDDEKGTFLSLAQRTFAQITDERAQLRNQIFSAASAVRPSPPHLGLLAPSHFRLWNDAPSILAEMFRCSTSPAGQSLRITRLDPDDPAASSHLALTLACRDCHAILMANCTRADFPDTIPPHVPVITWLTVPQIPSFTPAMAHDALLLADRGWIRLAQAAGWPASRLACATWPAYDTPPAPPDSPAHLALIADTRDIAHPPKPFDLSSHNLLWDLIIDDLRRDPFVLNGNVHPYLTSRMRRLEIDGQGFDRRLFLEDLISPAYQQSLARLLLQANLPVRLYGQGWADLPEFAPHAQGPIKSREDLLAAASAARALIHAWPASHAHPIDALLRPVLRPYTLSRSCFLQSARCLLTSSTPCKPPADPLTPALLASFLSFE